MDKWGNLCKFVGNFVEMSRMRIYRLLLFVCVLMSSFSAFSFEKADSVLNAFGKKNGMQKAKYGVCVIDLETGETVVNHCITDTFIPASITKLVTSAVTMKVLPENYKFKTRITTNGYILNGTLFGNLIIKGGVDPTIGSRHFPDQPSLVDECIMALIANGINKIKGKIVINKGLYHENAVPDDWEDADVIETFGAGLFAVNYHDNLSKVSVDISGDKPVIQYTYPCWDDFEINLDNLKIVKRKKDCRKVKQYRKKNSRKLRVSGAVLASETPLTFVTTMPDANRAFAQDLEESLLRVGISVEKDRVFAFGEKDALLIYESPAIEDIVKSLLYRSDNMYAEAVFRANCIGHKNNLSRKKSVKREKEILEDWGIEIDGLEFYDGSGLSRSNHFTPKFMGDLLKAIYNDKALFDRYLPLIPVTGKNGTVKKLLKDTFLSGHMALKSGSMKGVHSYAGYFPAGSPKYAVVVMANKFTCGYYKIKEYIEELLLGLFRDFNPENNAESILIAEEAKWVEE